MTGFSFDFPDDSVFDTLGDDVEVTPVGGEPVMIKAPFYMVHEDEEVNGRVDNNFPHLQDIQPKHLLLFKKGTLVKYEGKTYSYYATHPNKSNTWMIELKNEIKTW